MSLTAANSYPRFVMEGGVWGLYSSQIDEHRETKAGTPMKSAPDRFFTLRQLVEMGAFPQSVEHLRRVAQLQQRDPRRYIGKLRMSWGAIHSFPRFTSIGSRWGLYESQLVDWRARKGA